jgi:hypothetical protein
MLPLLPGPMPRSKTLPPTPEYACLHYGLSSCSTDCVNRLTDAAAFNHLNRYVARSAGTLKRRRKFLCSYMRS